MTSLSLQALLSEYTRTKVVDIPIQGLALDSRVVKPGDLFFALRAAEQDAHRYMEEAIKKGAAAIIYEAPDQPFNFKIPTYAIENLQNQAGHIAARFFQYPTKQLNVVGVTGTNGKSSYCHLLTQAYELLHQPAAMIGTLGQGTLHHLIESALTTPHAIQLQTFLAQCRDQKINHIAMEVSSHALTQGRIEGIEFDVAAFTNITHDHLDYHGTFEAYQAAKKSFFTEYPIKTAVINLADPFGAVIHAAASQRARCYTYSVYGNAADVTVSQLVHDQTGLTLDVRTPWGSGRAHAHLLGFFNASNLLAVITTLGAQGVSWSDCQAILPELHSVPGRMQIIRAPGAPLVVVDFAHTPDALEQVLAELTSFKPKRCICVFGCGGDRDRTKRPKMGRIAEQYCDHIYLTDDNPRFESSKQILDEIQQGLQDPQKVIVESNRERAIQQALKQAAPDDIVLIAGKGHETYQIYGDQRYPFNDVDIVRKCLLGE